MNCPDDDRLMAWREGDQTTPEAPGTAQHVAACDRCQARLARIEKIDRALGSEANQLVAAGVLHRVRRAVAEEMGQGTSTEVMTLNEAAAFLRLSPDDMDEVVPELPVFEIV